MTLGNNPSDEYIRRLREDVMRQKSDATFQLLVALMSLLIRVVMNGFVLQKLWNWFMPAAFPTLPTLRIGEALGVGCVAVVFTGAFSQATAKKSETQEKATALFMKRVVSNAMLLLYAWILHMVAF